MIFLGFWLFAAVGKRGWEVLFFMNVFLIGYKENFYFTFFCQLSMAMQQGSDHPTWRVFARVV